MAAELGVTVTRAQQIELSALRKLRRWCRQHSIRYADLVSVRATGEFCEL